MTSIDIVIPTYNRRSLVGRAILSAVAQTDVEVTIFVIDDGSTDGTQEHILQLEYPVQYVWQNNHGQGEARNRGARLGSGTFLAFLDSDDEWDSGFLATMLRAAQHRSDAAVLYCGMLGISASGDYVSRLFPVRDYFNSSSMYRQLLEGNFIFPSAVLIRREVFESVGMFDPSDRIRHREDWDLWLRIACAGHEFLPVDRYLVRHRLHSDKPGLNWAIVRRAAEEVVAKHVGSDDGPTSSWDEDKRIAYGGLYKTAGIDSLQFEGDASACAGFVGRALAIRPELAVDENLFHELMLGTQDPLVRGEVNLLRLDECREQLDKMLHLIADELDQRRYPWSRDARSTALLVLAKLAYSKDGRLAAARLIVSAVMWRPSLLLSMQIWALFVKSLLPAPALQWLRSTTWGRHSDSRICSDTAEQSGEVQ